MIDLAVLEENHCFEGKLFKELGHRVFGESTLNKFIELGPEFRVEARLTIQHLFAHGHAELAAEIKAKALFDAHTCQMLMPVFIRDYTDFYSSKNHAFNVGCMFRDPANALNPNWLHLPVGYHGRASSIVVSGTPVRRPKGQVSADKLTPQWSQC